jgi:glycosyltransferase involved in cell wall biosynthesis
VGRLEPQKRFDRLLRLLSILREKRVAFEARVVGTGSLRDELEREAKSRDLGSAKELFPGASTEMCAHYQWADLLVQSSDHEGTPNVVLEAMASGLPVVATAVGDTGDICPDGVCGIVRDPTDEEGLARAVETLASNADLQAKMGEAASANVRARFSVDRLPSLLEDLYSNLGVLA